MLRSCPWTETKPLVSEHAREHAPTQAPGRALALTGFVLLPLRAADAGGELCVRAQAVPLSPVDGVAAVPDAFAAAGPGQGQRRPLRGETENRQVIRSPAAHALGAARRLTSDLVGGAHAGLVGHVIGPPQLLDGLSWHGL